MTKLFRHAILLLAAVCMVVSCKDNAISADDLNTNGIKQGKVAYDTLDIDLRPATGDTIDLDEAVAIGLKLVSGSSPESITKDPYYIIGYVKGFTNKDSEASLKQYGNRFPIITNKLGNRSMQCYQLLNYRTEKFTNMDQLKVGDQIVVCGHIQNYSNTPQVAGGFLMTTDNPANPAPAPLDIHLREATGDTIDLDEAIRIGFSMPSSTKDPASTSTKSYYILGYVSGFDPQDTEESMKQYGNRYPILTNKRGDRFMLCYRLLGPKGEKFKEFSQLQVGDQVIVYGKIQNRLNAPQLTQGGYLVTTDNPNISARILVNETFDKGIGTFTIDNKIAASAPVWSHIDAKNSTPGYMRATAKINDVNEESESWLVSPVMDLTVCKHGAQMTFTQYYVGDKNSRDELLQILVSMDGGSTWDHIPTTDAMWNDGTLPQFQNVKIDLQYFISDQTQVAFVYKSTTEKALTWAVKNIVIGEPEF